MVSLTGLAPAKPSGLSRRAVLIRAKVTGT